MKVDIRRMFRRDDASAPIRRTGAELAVRETDDILNELENSYWDAVVNGVSAHGQEDRMTIPTGVRIRKASMERNMIRSMLIHELESQAALDLVREEITRAYEQLREGQGSRVSGRPGLPETEASDGGE